MCMTGRRFPCLTIFALNLAIAPDAYQISSAATIQNHEKLPPSQAEACF